MAAGAVALHSHPPRTFTDVRDRAAGINRNTHYGPVETIVPLPEVLMTMLADVLKSGLGALIGPAMHRTTGDRRALLDELRSNHGYCRIVLDHKVAPSTVIPHLSTREYDRLLKGGFNFNSLCRSRIRIGAKSTPMQLVAYDGMPTSVLIERIYDRIKELKRLHAVTPGNPDVRWTVRVKTLDTRMRLLWGHLSHK